MNSKLNVNEENVQAHRHGGQPQGVEVKESSAPAVFGAATCSVLVGFAFIVLIAAWFIPSMIQIQGKFQNLLADYTGWFVLYQLVLSILVVKTLDSLLLFLRACSNKLKVRLGISGTPQTKAA